MIYLLLLSLMVTSGQSLPDSDPLKSILREMESAACCRFEFISIVDSDVFDSVDSTMGDALIASDGRYRVILGSDEYLQTSDTLYSFSREHNQVTVEPNPAGGSEGEQISFLTRLEEFYWIAAAKPEGTYELTIRSQEEAALPSRMTLGLSADYGEIAWLEYVDDNGDLNRIKFTARMFWEQCDDAKLTPHYTPPVEIIKLY